MSILLIKFLVKSAYVDLISYPPPQVLLLLLECGGEEEGECAQNTSQDNLSQYTEPNSMLDYGSTPARS